MDRRDQIKRVILSLFLVDDFLKELLASIIFSEVILVPVQTVLGQLDIARHSEQELLQTLAESVLHDCEVLGEHIDALDDRHVDDRDTTFDCEFLKRFANHL